MPHTTDLNLGPSDVAGLASADAMAGVLTQLGYETGARAELTPEAIGLSGDSATAIRRIERLSEDSEGFLNVVFAQLRSLTARSRNDLARVLGRTNVDHVLILTSDFGILEFVLLDKQIRQRSGPGATHRVQVTPRVIAVDRKAPGRLQLRALRRLTWTTRDGLEQFDKLRSVFEAAAFTEEYFQNRALFADHYLLDRLRDAREWRDNPSAVFLKVRELMQDAHQRLVGQPEESTRRAATCCRYARPPTTKPA